MTQSILDLELTYEPRLTKIEIQGTILFSRVPVQGQAFLTETMGVSGHGALTARQMYGRRWADDPAVMREFRKLGESDKLSVLKFISAEIHEVTHHVDYLRTPFGASFHSRSIREHLALRRLAPLLLARPELLDIRPLWKLEETQLSNGDPYDPAVDVADPEFTKAWSDMCSPAGTFEALGDGGSATPHASQIVDGWEGDTQQVQVLGQEFRKVTVNKFFQTIALSKPTPSGPQWYLRPLAILECRAVAQSLIWTGSLLGPDASPLLYYDRFYAGASRDYTFLPDLFARAYSYPDFRGLLASGDYDSIGHVLRQMVAACWYALHAPPLMSKDTLSFSNPVIRLLVFLRPNEFLQRPFPFASLYHYTVAVDKAKYATDCYFGSGPHYTLADVFKKCREVFHHLIGFVVDAKLAPEVQQHFFRIIRIVYGQFCRYPTYVDPIGMDLLGNPIKGSVWEQDRTLVFDVYEPDPSVVAMFAFRKQLLFSAVGRREQLIEGLRKHFID
jgi:hypothetical protein